MTEGVPPVPHLDVKRAIVRPVTRKMAEQIILKYEWLGTLPSTQWHYGLFFGNYCAGVACIGKGVVPSAYMHEQFKIEREELLTLARGANVHWSPPGANSRLVAWACKLIERERYGKVLTAFSDPEAGEIGTIYQACNWIYIGQSEGITRRDMEIVAPSGRIYNHRAIGGFAAKRGMSYLAMKEKLLGAGWHFQAGNPKHRYVYVLDRTDKALIARLEEMRQPYPKRATSIGSDASGVQLEEGGARPTVALESPRKVGDGGKAR